MGCSKVQRIRELIIDLTASLLHFGTRNWYMIIYLAPAYTQAVVCGMFRIHGMGAMHWNAS